MISVSERNLFGRYFERPNASPLPRPKVSRISHQRFSRTRPMSSGVYLRPGSMDLSLPHRNPQHDAGTQAVTRETRRQKAGQLKLSIELVVGRNVLDVGGPHPGEGITQTRVTGISRELRRRADQRRFTRRMRGRERQVEAATQISGRAEAVRIGKGRTREALDVTEP